MRYNPTLPAHERGSKKRTSIGHSNRTRPKNKNKRRQYKKYNGQGNNKGAERLPYFFTLIQMWSINKRSIPVILS